MKSSPFVYGSTVSSHSFTNRETETAKLKSNLLNGINTTIISPRRWGKSSLVERVMMEINEKERNTKTIVIDLFATSTEEEFFETFAREVIKASSSGVQEWLHNGKEFLQKLNPKITVGVNPKVDFSISFDWQELKKKQ